MSVKAEDMALSLDFEEKVTLRVWTAINDLLDASIRPPDDQLVKLEDERDRIRQEFLTKLAQNYDFAFQLSSSALVQMISRDLVADANFQKAIVDMVKYNLQNEWTKDTTTTTGGTSYEYR